MQTLTITRPDDWHLHLRYGAALAAVLPHTAERFARARSQGLRMSVRITDVERRTGVGARIEAGLVAAGGERERCHENEARSGRDHGSERIIERAPSRGGVSR